jgi:hypothetical protein
MKFPSLHGEVVRQWGKLVEIAARWPLSRRDPPSAVETLGLTKSRWLY